MDWKEAFVMQARSDYEMLERLNRSDCEYSHRLHYLQMFSEKLAKGWMAEFEARRPNLSHVVLVRMLQNLKGRPEVREHLGYSASSVFKRYIDSLLETARRVEALAPSSAGLEGPNPEYPWRDRATRHLFVPCQFEFTEFDPTSPRMQKLTDLLRRLLKVAE
ncbi:MAG TPA: hypothetical protein VGN88_05080 [Phycisphaerae bacterium]|jgi:hypothetical protein